MTPLQISLDSPIGRLLVLAEGDALIALHPADVKGEGREARDGTGHPVLERARVELAEYFAGRRRSFDLPTAPRGTAFQHEVWRALGAIPFGATCSYAELATGLGRPTASRAVGGANGRNPLFIVVPCHRVIGTDGSLTGYAGGLERKKWLLQHEKTAA
jgi:methylated-DNA-[protein]-cysteine S-methyltransferase